MASAIALCFVSPDRAHILIEDVEAFIPNGVHAYDPEKAKHFDEVGVVYSNRDGLRDWNGNPIGFALRTRTGAQKSDIETVESFHGFLADVGIKFKSDIGDMESLPEELSQPIADAPYYDKANLSWWSSVRLDIPATMLCPVMPSWELTGITRTDAILQ